MDRIEEDPSQAYPKGDADKVQYKTGDLLIDKWEEERAKSIPSDFSEGLDDAGKKLLNFLKKAASPTK